MATADIRPYRDQDDRDARAIARLSTTVQWPSLTDAEVVHRVCTAPGAAAYVADVDGELVGWAQAMGDGVLQSHLGFVAVHPDHRGRGIARLLVVATFQATGTLRMDLITDTATGLQPHPDAGLPDLPRRLSEELAPARGYAVSWRRTKTSRTSIRIAAAVGMASSAPTTPSRAAPTSAAITMTAPGRSTERDITRG